MAEMMNMMKNALAIGNNECDRAEKILETDLSFPNILITRQQRRRSTSLDDSPTGVRLTNERPTIKQSNMLHGLEMNLWNQLPKAFNASSIVKTEIRTKSNLLKMLS